VKDDMLGKAMEIGQGLAKVRKKYYPKHHSLINLIRINTSCKIHLLDNLLVITFNKTLQKQQLQSKKIKLGKL
jgi:hypothetical protein